MLIDSAWKLITCPICGNERTGIGTADTDKRCMCEKCKEIDENIKRKIHFEKNELMNKLWQKLSNEIIMYMHKSSVNEFAERLDLRLDHVVSQDFYLFAGFVAGRIDAIITKIFDNLQQLEEK